MTQEEVWHLSDDELIDELGALNGTDQEQRMLEREALRRILQRLPIPANTL
jgi:hypothetical protein